MGRRREGAAQSAPCSFAISACYNPRRPGCHSREGERPREPPLAALPRENGAIRFFLAQRRRGAERFSHKAHKGCKVFLGVRYLDRINKIYRICLGRRREGAAPSAPCSFAISACYNQRRPGCHSREGRASARPPDGPPFAPYRSRRAFPSMFFGSVVVFPLALRNLLPWRL